MNDRFELIEEPTGTWAVFDTAMGVPADIENRVLIGLSKEEAEACIARLRRGAGVRLRLTSVATASPTGSQSD